MESARSLCSYLCEYSPRNAEAGLLKLSDGLVEIDETGLFSFIEDGKRAGDLQAPANCFLPPRLLVHEHHGGIHLRREHDRLAFGEVKLPHCEVAFRTEGFHPRQSVASPVSERRRRK